METQTKASSCALFLENDQHSLHSLTKNFANRTPTVQQDKPFFHQASFVPELLLPLTSILPPRSFLQSTEDIARWYFICSLY